MKRYTKFSYEQINSWRHIPLRTVVKVANACHSGTNCMGISKSAIYESLDMGRGDIKMFEDMMNILTGIHCRAAEKLAREVSETIREIVKYRNP
jgi:hypothetical protein